MPQAAAAVVWQLAAATAVAVGTSGATAMAVGNFAVAAATATAKVALLAAANKVIAHQNRPRPQGGLITLGLSPDAPRRLQIGTRLNAGVLADWYVTGSKNQRLFMIVYLGEGPMGALNKVYGGGRAVYSTPIAHGTRTVIPNYRSGGDRLWITYYDGRAGQTADPTLTALGLGWTSDCVGTGCAYAIIEALWDSDNQTSPPQIAFEIEGAKLYDRRKDTTAGGSGSHRANDPSTWEVSANPAVALDHYLLGRYLSGVKTFGIGLDADDVPYARFAALANLCDEDVSLSTGGTQDRYAANGFLFADRSYADTIRDLCRAMNARPADLGGRIGIIDGEERTPVLTLYDADVVGLAPEAYTPKRSWGEMVNVVRGTYQNAAQNYQASEYPRVSDSAWLTEDGGTPKEATLDLEMETHPERAQRLAWLYGKRERRQATLTGTYALRAIELEQGDWFIRSGGIFGEGKTFEVIDRVLNPADFTVTLNAFEVDPADTAWDTDIPSPAPANPVSSTDTLQAMEVPALTVTGVTLTGTAAQLPAIRVQWTAPTDPRVRQIVVEAVPDGGGVPMSQTVDFATGQVVFTNGITDDTDYLVRARFTGEYIPSAWTSNFAVTTVGTYSVGTATSVPWSGLTGTIPAGVNNGNVPAGTNMLIHPSFQVVSGLWAINSTVADTRSTAESNGIRYRQAQLNGTPAAGQNTIINAFYPTNALAVKPGDRVGVRALLGAVNMSTIRLAISWYNSGGGNFQDSVIQDVTSGILAGAGAVASYNELKGAVDVPATAVLAIFYVRGYANGSATPTLRLARPVMGLIPAGQVEPPPWSPGIIRPGADIYLNGIGTMTDWRGMPTNLGGGGASVADAPSFAFPSIGQISINATNRYLAGQTLSLPSATITGLSNSTKYYVARDLVSSTYITSTSFSTVTGWLTDTENRYLYMGSYTTRDGGGSGGSSGTGDITYTLP
jgi:hypothetical protein